MEEKKSLPQNPQSRLSGGGLPTAPRPFGRGQRPIFQIANRHALEDLLTAQYPWPWYGQLMNTAQTIAYMLQVNHWMEVYRVELV